MSRTAIGLALAGFLFGIIADRAAATQPRLIFYRGDGAPWTYIKPGSTPCDWTVTK